MWVEYDLDGELVHEFIPPVEDDDYENEIDNHLSWGNE